MRRIKLAPLLTGSGAIEIRSRGIPAAWGVVLGGSLYKQNMYYREAKPMMDVQASKNAVCIKIL